MSVVTGIVVFASLSEPKSNIQALDNWLDIQGFCALQPLDDVVSGDKHPQIQILGGAFNYFKNEGFIRLFLAMDWRVLDHAVLVLHPEEGPVKVYRPGKKVSS